MSNFAVDTNDVNNNDIVSTLNYLLANMSQGTVVSSATGQISNPGTATVIGYIYQYMHIRYANNSTGTSGFSANSTNALFYGLRNDNSPVDSNNPADYIWTQVTGGFGTTQHLYYLTPGGRQFQSNVNSSPPASLWAVANANVAINLDTVSSANGTPGTNGSRGFIPMAYVLTASDPTSYTDTQYTTAFSASRTNSSPPIGTGFTPVTGDTAQFHYTAGNIDAYKTYNANGSPNWTTVTGSVISGNVLVNGTITSNKLNTNEIYTLDIQSTNATYNSISSAGFWLNGVTGDAHFAGNVTIGANLNVVGLITNGTLVPGSVTGNSVTANSLPGNSITANSMTVDRLTSSNVDLSAGLNFSLGQGIKFNGLSAAVVGQGTGKSTVGGAFESNRNWGLAAGSSNVTVGDNYSAAFFRAQNNEDYVSGEYWNVSQVAGDTRGFRTTTYYANTVVQIDTVLNDTSQPGNVGLNTSGSAIVAGTHYPFTGSHFALIDNSQNIVIGDIVVDVELVGDSSINNTLTIVDYCNVANQASALGVVTEVVKNNTLTPSYIPQSIAVFTQATVNGITVGSWRVNPSYQTLYDNNQIIGVNALGEGLINVCGLGGNISIGDYITTSNIAGKGQRQNDDTLHNYTVAKARQSVDFATPTDTATIACTYHAG